MKTLEREVAFALRTCRAAGWFVTAILAVFFSQSEIARGEDAVASPVVAAAPVVVAAAHSPAVEEALYQEIYGYNEERRELLEAALADDPESPRLRGLLGQVQVDGQWRPLRDVYSPGAGDALLNEYAQRRTASENTVESQAALACWCRQQGLADRERLHWQQVLAIDPTHEAAMTRLGLFRTDDGRLVTREALDAEREVLRQFEDADKQWRPVLARYKRAIERGTPEEREAAIASLHDITDEWALPTLEDLYSTEGGELALLAVEVLSDIRHPWATQSLMRHAILSEDEVVRTAAIEQLKSRSVYEYVPMLLEELQPTLEAEFTVTLDGTGNVNLRHWLHWEARDGDYTSTYDETLYQFNHVVPRVLVVTRLPDGRHVQNYRDNRAMRERAEAQIGYQAALTVEGQRKIVANAQAEVATLNERIEAGNDRVCTVLAVVVGEDSFETPLDWWQWWDDYNLTQFTTQREERRHYAWQHRAVDFAPPTSEYLVMPRQNTGEEQQISLEEESDTVRWSGRWRFTWDFEAWRPRPASFAYGPFSMYGRPSRYDPNRRTLYSCFTAGTPVWTETGLRSIEEIQPGDRVLARDVETGELLYKIVTQCTQREPTEVLSLVVNGETFGTTPGHLFWVNGRGWTMARDLSSGDVLHGIDGGLLVSEVAPQQEPQAVYNLVVEEHHNYFVGYGQVLAHDVTIQEPTQAIVPGLVEGN